MLHYEAIDPSALEILKNLIHIPEFSELRLVGGTSLALPVDDLHFFVLLQLNMFKHMNITYS